MSDVDGQASSKRLVTLISFLVLLSTWGANMFAGKTVDEFIYDGFLYIVCVGLGVVAAEKFAKRK